MGNPASRIGNLDGQRAGIIGFRRNGHRSSCISELQGVSNQIGQYLTSCLPVSEDDGNACHCLEPKRYALLYSEWIGGGFDRIHDVDDIDFLG